VAAGSGLITAGVVLFFIDRAGAARPAVRAGAAIHGDGAGVWLSGTF
jgi:hypothetical protein